VISADDINNLRIALETSKGDLPLALGLGLVLLAVVGALHAVLGYWRWRSARRVQ
jgi:ABC-type tungstate transport system substrate-binding protein